MKKSFSALGLNLGTAVFATGREDLGELLTREFKTSDAVFTVGGLAFEDSRGIRDTVSQAAAGSSPGLCRRLKNPQGNDGFLIRAGSQILVMLPDEPSQIEEIMRGGLAEYIRTIR